MSYEEKYVPRGMGFVNSHAMCYLNSLLQSLLSLPALFNTLLKQRDALNPLARHLLNIHETGMHGGVIANLNQAVFDELLRISSHRNAHSEIKINLGQQDIHEALSFILDGLENIPGVNNLFIHRFKWQALCHKCREWTATQKPTGRVFILEPNLTIDQDERFKDIDPSCGRSMPLNEFLTVQRSCTDDDYKCPRCKEPGKKFTETKLTMVPEILPIMLKKYTAKTVTVFPMELTFSSLHNKNKNLVYELVAQVEHLGGQGGGHYFAICKRSDGWKTLNDNNVSVGIPAPTENTYMLFYHYAGMRDKY